MKETRSLYSKKHNRPSSIELTSQTIKNKASNLAGFTNNMSNLYKNKNKMLMNIIFRGKQMGVSEQKWIYGSLIIDKYKSTSIYNPLIHDGIYIDISSATRYVYEDTVGQYIGVSDKNKTKIFDGDIVKHILWNQLFVIRYSTHTKGFILLNIKNGAERLIHSPLNLVVVGNIYDNKELLK